VNHYRIDSPRSAVVFAKQPRRAWYYAFGETRLSTGTMFTDRLFTGQRQIAELGIYHYNARFYSPKLGRFLSADTLMSGFASPQNLNRFAYVANNPVRYTDPSGHMLMADTEGGGGSYTTSPIADYCATHPSVCSGGSGDSDDDGGGGGGGSDYCATHIGSCGNPIPLPPQVMGTSQLGENFILDWEDFWDTPYEDGGGNCTIGYGTVLAPDRCPKSIREKYIPELGGTPLQKAQGLLWFHNDLAIFEQVIKDNVNVDLTQPQFDALVSYLYNSGDQPENPFFEKKMPELLNSGNFDEVASAIESGPLYSNDEFQPGLERRRREEAAMFLYGVYP
jgi:RHS repeat-associated protein